MFATQTRDLSHIELTRIGNISSLSVAKAYRVNKVDISTEEKREQEYKEKLLIFLLFFFFSLKFCLLLQIALGNYNKPSPVGEGGTSKASDG